MTVTARSTAASLRADLDLDALGIALAAELFGQTFERSAVEVCNTIDLARGQAGDGGDDFVCKCNFAALGLFDDFAIVDDDFFAHWEHLRKIIEALQAQKSKVRFQTFAFIV